MKTPLVRSIASALALAALTAFPICAATVDELVTGLRADVEKSLQEAKAAKTSSYTTSEIERQLLQFETALSKDSIDEADRALNQLAVAKLSMDAKEKISQLQKELPKVAEERQKAFAAQVAATIEKAGKACLAAKAESDLDPVLLELGALKKTRYDSNSANTEVRQRMYSRIDGALRFVNRWQDSLVQSARGFDSASQTILRELAEPSSTSYYPILSRAEIVARMGKDADVAGKDQVKGIKSLDELPKVIADINRQIRENGSRAAFENNSLVSDLTQISRAHAAFQSGNYGLALMTAGQSEVNSGMRSPESLRLKSMLVLEIAPRFLELSDNPQPKDGENPSEFLLRIASEGVAQGEWLRVARALDAYRLVAFGYRQPPAWIGAELDACQQYVAGQNLEKAKRITPAILAYQRAVKVSGKHSPQKAATERLAVLEKEFPTEFAEAGKEPQVRELLDALNSSNSQRPNPASIPNPGF